MAVPFSLDPDRSLVATLRVVETTVWSLSFLVVLALAVGSLAGAFVVADVPLTTPMLGALVACVVGTVVFVVADVVLG